MAAQWRVLLTEPNNVNAKDIWLEIRAYNDHRVVCMFSCVPLVWLCVKVYIM